LSKAVAEKVYSDLVIPENELEKFYEQNKQQFEASWQSDIQVAYFDQEPAIEQLADALRGGADFALEAGKLGSKEAGPLSGVAPTSQLPKTLLEVVSVLGPSELSRPFKLGEGFAVVWVTKRTNIIPRDFEAAKAEISEVMLDKKRKTLFAVWFDKQLSKAKVEVFHYGTWKPKYQLVS
jgi:parvulin-like peptidyl-prolyl isomerase